jgi:FMN phosphatase YigB (HAD superfamily)
MWRGSPEPPKWGTSSSLESGGFSKDMRGALVLKAVTFDFWQTLVTETPEGSQWARAERIRRIDGVLRAQQIISDPEAIARAYITQGERLEQLWKTNHDITARAQVAMLLDLLQVTRYSQHWDLLDRLVDAYTRPILSAMPEPVENAPEILSALEGQGFRLAVICNTGRTPGKILRIILERLRMAGPLSVKSFSDEIGLRKPHPEIFERTLAALGVQPPEAVHVGDSLASDIAGARSLGMRAVHLCHSKGASPSPGEGDTIFALKELQLLINSWCEDIHRDREL